MNWNVTPSHRNSLRKHFFEVVLLLLCFGNIAVGQSASISGTVHDSNGSTIADAVVTFNSTGFTTTARTNASGQFTFPSITQGSGFIRVTATGFSPEEQRWSAAENAVQLTFVLHPQGPNERVVVSATRTEMKISDAPGSPVVLSPEDISANAALNLDDALRQVPGFTLFRRASSRVANPTTQGVSLRGVGASGPSRALVLEDGIPIVDPFGGWVYWDRLPRAELDSIEVFRGGVSNLYGSDALGGVVQFLSRVPAQPSAAVDISYGNENTPDLSAWTGTTISKWDISTAVDMARTDGYILVPSFQRGIVDTDANSKHATVDATVGYRISETGRVFLRGTFFDESRNNGTTAQTNSTGTGFGVIGLNTGVGVHDWISARLYGQSQGYDQTFSSVATARNKEQLTDDQHVPSQQLGGGVQWNHLFKSQTLIAGVESEEVMGASDEQLFSSTPPGANFADKIAAGRQRSTGIFGEDVIRFRNTWTFIAGLRWDDWNNFLGSLVRTNLPAGPIVGTAFPDRSDNSFSPRLSLTHALKDNVSVSLSGYRAFRAPTLNELYRTFQQGSIITESNAQLRAERLTGAEAGVRATGFGSKLEARGTFFWSDITAPITNVTLTATTRERENLGRTRSLGAEFDGVLRLTSSVQLSAGYQYTHATVVDSTPTLIGLNVPEVPRQQLTWELRYWNPRRLLLSVEGRYAGLQFDDDLNTLRLNRYYVLDLFLGRQLGHGLEGYIAAENLTNDRYVTALTGIENLGPPILARIGLRYQFPSGK